jgi:hypothetical protein
MTEPTFYYSSCGFGHKVKFVGHKMRILSVINKICAHHFISTERLQKRKSMISVGFARVRKKRPCRNHTSQFEAKHPCPSSMPH